MKDYSQKNTITISNQGKIGKEIDLTPVEELKSRLEKALFGRETWKDRSHILKTIEIRKDYKKLNKNQKDFFNNYLISKLTEVTDLYLSALENPEKIKEYKDFFDLVKEKTKNIPTIPEIPKFYS